ncbi:MULTISPECIES: universal stress protein [Mycolicibacterium]|uniref:universal stress protein n=1 Tax=Mycolicibacterium TaxID=1866885 RepID=UPI00148F8AD3|nr:universal stress protein [Mycolicibacterium fortuitum]
MPVASTTPSIVAHINGSGAAVAAAIWGAKEAYRRDIPLRLLYAVHRGDQVAALGSADRATRADIAVRHAREAVEATGLQVKFEVQIAEGTAAAALIRASRSAAMVCMGAAGVDACSSNYAVTAAVAAAARCPVAIIRQRAAAAPWLPGAIFAALPDLNNAEALVQAAMEQAQVRGLPIRAVTCWQTRFSDIHDPDAISNGNRMMRARLDRYLARWACRYPDVTVTPVAVHGSVLNDLARCAYSIDLVIGARDREQGRFAGQLGEAVLHHTDCSLLVVDSATTAGT